MPVCRRREGPRRADQLLDRPCVDAKKLKRQRKPLPDRFSNHALMYAPRFAREVARECQRRAIGRRANPAAAPLILLTVAIKVSVGIKVSGTKK
jgi:hypothetical protein